MPCATPDGGPGVLKVAISFFSNLIFSPQTSHTIYENTVICCFSHLHLEMKDNWFQCTLSLSVIHYTSCRFINHLFLQHPPSLQIYSPFLQPGGDVWQGAARQTGFMRTFSLPTSQVNHFSHERRT